MSKFAEYAPVSSLTVCSGRRLQAPLVAALRASHPGYLKR